MAKAISFCTSKEDCWRISPSCFVSPRRDSNSNSSHSFLWEVFSLPPAQRAEQGSYPPFPTEAECMQESASRHPSCMQATTHMDWLLCLFNSLLLCVSSPLTQPDIPVPAVASAALGGRQATYRHDSESLWISLVSLRN